MAIYRHHVSGFFVNRDEADIAMGKLLADGLAPENVFIYSNSNAAISPDPNADSPTALKGLFVDGAIGAAVGTGIGALGELALIAANVTLFVASPLLAPLVMLGWGASLGAVVGAVAGAVNNPKKDGKFADLVQDAIAQGQVVLVATTQSPAQTQVATDVLQEAVGSVKDVALA